MYILFRSVSRQIYKRIIFILKITTVIKTGTYPVLRNNFVAKVLCISWSRFSYQGVPKDLPSYRINLTNHLMAK